jgi:Spy/CpxP family protein refolding chaperone
MHDGPGMHDGGPMMMMLGDDLGLTPEQREKLRTKLEAQAKTQQQAMKNRMAAMEKHLLALATAFEAENFDAKKAGVGAQAPEMVKTMAADRIKFVEIVLAILTPDQRPKFADHLRAHLAHEEQS